LKYVIINGEFINYRIYEVSKVKQDNTKSLSQDTKGTKIVTLVTCDDINNKIRYIVKAREIK